MMVYLIQKIEGVINATGNVVLENASPKINVEEVFIARLIKRIFFSGNTKNTNTKRKIEVF